MSDPSADEVAIALDRYEHRAAEILRFLDQYYVIHEAYTQVYDRLQTFSDKLRHPTFIPIGKHAFIPGQITNTNQLTAHIGENYYREMTVKQATEMVTRRLIGLERDIERHLRELDVFGDHIKHAHDILGPPTEAPSISERMRDHLVVKNKPTSVPDQDHTNNEPTSSVIRNATVTKCGVNDDGDDILDIVEYEEDEPQSNDVHTSSLHTSTQSDQSLYQHSQVTKQQLFNVFANTLTDPSEQGLGEEDPANPRSDLDIYQDHMFLAKQLRQNKLIEVLSDDENDDAVVAAGTSIDPTDHEPSSVGSVASPSTQQRATSDPPVSSQEISTEDDRQQQVDAMRQLILDSMIVDESSEQQHAIQQETSEAISSEVAVNDTKPGDATPAAAATALSTPLDVTASREAYQQYLRTITAGAASTAPQTLHDTSHKDVNDIDTDDNDEDYDAYEGEEDWGQYMEDLEAIYGFLGEGEDTVYEELLWDHLQSVVSEADGGLSQAYTSKQQTNEQATEAEIDAANKSTVIPNQRPIYASFGVHTDYDGHHVLAPIGVDDGQVDEADLDDTERDLATANQTNTNPISNTTEIKQRTRKPRPSQESTSDNLSTTTPTRSMSRFKQQKLAERK